MYKVVVVDDDSIILKGLIRNIPWRQHGFELVGSARDGEEALEIIPEKQPHVIVTDIRMPFMDGFGLTEAVKEKYPDIKVIMLTSFDDFELAKKALQLKVFDYLLKPVDNQSLLSAAERAIKELEYEREMKRKVIEGMPLLRQRFLEQLIKGNMSGEEIRTNSEFLNISLPEAQYAVLLLKADDYSYPEYQNRFGKEMLKYCILNAAEEIMRDEYGGIVFDSHDDEIVIIYFETEEEDLIQQKMIQIAENMRQKIEKYLKTTVSIGIGFIYDSCRDISLSYRDAKSTFEFRHMIGKNRVLISGDTGLPPSSFAKIKLHGLEKEFAMNVKLGLENKAFSILDEIEQMLLEMKYVTLSQLRLIGVEITLPLFKEFEEWISDSEMLVTESGEVTDFYLFNQNVERYQTNDELFSALRRLTKHFVDIANHQRERQMKSNIHTAMDYMEKNFMVEGLSLLDVAGYVHISPTYLSILFKKEKNITFSDYLLQLRMKSAMELLRITDLKTYEVADKVGYSNPQYFSQCFKKYTGFSPTDYKNSAT